MQTFQPAGVNICWKTTHTVLKWSPALSTPWDCRSEKARKLIRSDWTVVQLLLQLPRDHS